MKDVDADERTKQHEKYMRKITRQKQILFCKIMNKYSGNPLGVEFWRESTDSWAFIVENMDGGGAYRMQFFDRDGFFGHGYRESVASCMEELISQGYRLEDSNALETTSQTIRWKNGLKRASIRQKQENGLISFSEMLNELKKAA
jgi:hypothetical protein